MIKTIKTIIVIFLLNAVILSCSTTPMSDSGTVEIPNDFLGIVHAGRSNSVKEYQLIDQLGADWVLTTFYWSSIESERGNFNYSSYDEYVDFARTQDKKVIAVLAYSTDWVNEKRYISNANIVHFLNYVEKTVTHFKGRVDVWQIWNEPNFSFWKGSNKDFFELSKQAAAKIRETDPDAFIIGGGLWRTPKGFILGMHKAGAFENLDAVSFHPYAVTPRGSTKLHDDFIKLRDKTGFTGETWITEVGYPTSGWYPTKVSLENFSSYIIKTIVPASVRGARTLFWYELFDKYNRGEEIKKSESEYFFGLVYPDYSWKDGAWAFSLCGKYLPGSRYMPELPKRDSIPSSIVSFYFSEGLSGYNTLVLWNDRNSSFKVKLSLSSPFNMHDISSDNVTVMHDESILEITDKPVFITWQGSSSFMPIISKEK